SKTDDYSQRLYYQESDFEIVERVVELAKKKSVEPIQIALAWLLHKPWVTAPIVGVSKAGQLKSLLKAFDVKLSEEEMKFLEDCYKPHVVQEYK
ncbi:MAG: aldo/keto reductase, partial [Thermoanaerobaculia bacterium]